MHFHILGVGPIGCLLAHNLHRILPTGHRITLIHKTLEDHRRILLARSLTLERDGQLQKTREQAFLHEVFKDPRSETEMKQLPGSKKTDSREPQDGPISSVFVALKAHHTVNALKALSPRITPSSTIVLLQNGMGVYEKLLTEVFRNPNNRPHFILASNTHGAFATNFYHVVHAGIGSIEFAVAPDPDGRNYEAGLYDEGVEEGQRRLRISDISPSQDPESAKYKSLRTTVAAMLLLESLNASWKPLSDIQLTMRRKLAVNAVINPLTALLGCRNGELFAHEPAKDILGQVCDEASAVYTAQMEEETAMMVRHLERQGVDTSQLSLPPFPDSLTSRSLQQEVNRVAHITQGNISSMLQDVRRGRKTEVDFINGYLDELGLELGVPTPANSTLANLVRMKSILPLSQ